MRSLEEWFNTDIPKKWGQLLVRTVLVALVAFVILQIKEVVDAGIFDTPATAADAILIAGGVLVLNAILMWVKSR